MPSLPIKNTDKSNLYIISNRAEKLACFLIFFSLLLLGGALLTWRQKRVVKAASSTYTSSTDFQLGYFNNTEAVSKQGEIKLKPTGDWDDYVVNFFPMNLTYGSAQVSDGSYLYVLTGRDVYFARYLPDENRWQKLADAPFGNNMKSDMTYQDGYIYVVFGAYQKKFARYHIATDSWEELNDLPDYVHYGVSLASDGTNIYILRATSSSDFWRYNVDAGTFTTLTGLPAAAYNGSDLVYYDGYLFTPRGANQRNFYRYDIAANSWSSMTQTPIAFNDDRNIDVVDGYIYVSRGGNTANFYRYNVSGNSWDILASTPENSRYAGGVVYLAANDTIYFFRGNGTPDIWTYNLSPSDSFTSIDALPSGPSTGADLVYYDGYLYLPRGANSQNFYRYNQSSNIWETRTSTPARFNYDSKGVAAGDTLYFFRGTSTTFYSYTTADDTWNTLATTPASVGHGAALVYPGSGDYLYATRGSNTSAFWRYSISGDSWDDGAADDLPSSARAYYGSRLIWDGSYIYALTSGSGPDKLYRYTLGGSWTDMGDLPFVPFLGTDAVYYNGKIYAQAGYYKTEFWEYSISGETWRQLPDTPALYQQAVGPYAGGSLEVDASGSLYSIWGNSYGRMQRYTIAANNYPVSGTWQSNYLDLSYVSAFGALTINDSTPGDSSITYYTRSSADTDTWTTWEELSGEDIQSTANRYLQIKAQIFATSDQSQTPIIYDLSVNYTGDETDPENPDTINVYSQQVNGTLLLNGQTYRYQHPYFSWSGASDSESSIAGYYVYFGTTADADPETNGHYQAGSSLIITTPLSIGTYYLRIKTKDTVDNIADVWDAFTYVYQGVETQSLSISEEAEMQGVGESVSVSDGQIKLSSYSGGRWLEDRLTYPTVAMSYGSEFAYVEDTNKLYTFRGNGSNNFYVYDVEADTWTALANAPAAVRYGGFVVEGPDGYLYAAAGNNTNYFWQYDIAANQWSDANASNTPGTIYYGGAAAFDNNHYIYVTRGYNDDAFYRYDTDSDGWESLANAEFEVANSIYQGGDLTFDGQDLIYAIQGNLRGGFSVYSINSDSWTPLPTLPDIAYLGASIAFDADNNAIYYTPGYQKSAFYKYDITSQEWSAVSDLPYRVYYGGDIRVAGNYIYAIRGENSTSFYRYDVDNDSWMVPNRGLFGAYFRGSSYYNFNYGADIVKGDGNDYFIVKGNYDSLFSKYNPVTGISTKLVNTPAGFYTGGDLVYESSNQKIYASAASGNQNFYVYDISTDVWSTVSTDPFPVIPSTGASMTYDGTGYIYYARGGGTTTFYRYDIDGNAGERWEQLNNVPASLNYGSELVYKNGIIYTLRGSNVNPNPLYAYDTSVGTWGSLMSLAKDVYNDGFLADGGDGYLYACKGENTTSCYRYWISGNSWEAVNDAPAQIYTGGAVAANQTDKLYVIAGAGTNSYQDGLYTYVLPTSESSFARSGAYTSQVHDLSAVYRFANIDLTYTSASNTNLTVSTRTSVDNETWDLWAEAAGEQINGTAYTYEIKSSAGRYVQVKFELISSDGVYSGAIDDYTINYYQDLIAPSNPSSLSAYTTATKSATLASNAWAKYANPYFDWPEEDANGGATDTSIGSGVNGYWLYFGTDSDALATESGTLQTATDFTASSTLSSGQTYYLNIQAVDKAGNFDDNWQAFIYKYDNVNPTNPQTVTADPPGYTASNSFDFSWTGATDSASVIAEYCYKTGAVGFEDLCTSGNSVSGITSYLTGTNTFYVRSKDNAGNIPSEYSTASYYYNSTAPSPPQNVVITPATNDKNEFAFSWEPPLAYKGAQSGLRYYYSINEEPTANNINAVGLINTYLPAGAYASQMGSNTFYVVAKDEAGNVDYSLYYKDPVTNRAPTFIIDTETPTEPQNIEIADVSVKATKSWRLALSWDEPESTGSGISTYKVLRSTVDDADCDTDISNFTLLASASTTSYVDTNLVQDTYYYCSQACDSVNNCSTYSDTVSLYPDGRWLAAPDLTASPSAEVRTKTATISWSTSRTCNSFVKYGTSSGSYGDEVGSSLHVTSHEVELEGLEPGTTYYYKAQYTDEDGNSGISDEYSFKTAPAPSVSNVEVAELGINKAIIRFAVENSTSVSLNYGTTIDYGKSETLTTSLTRATHLVELKNLQEDTSYHFTILSLDSEGYSYIGDDYTFTTLPTPKIVKAAIQQVKGMPTATVRVLWISNTPITSILTYYPEEHKEAAYDKVAIARTTGHEMLVKDLDDNTNYIFIIKGRDLAGNEVQALVKNIKTAQDLRAPQIKNLQVESSIRGVGGDAWAQIVISYDTDEPTSSQVEYGEGSTGAFSAKTQEDSKLTTSHFVTIPNLLPSKVYHLQVVTKDESGNISRSVDTVIITPKATNSALDLVVKNLSGTFGFLGKFVQ